MYKNYPVSLLVPAVLALAAVAPLRADDDPIHYLLTDKVYREVHAADAKIKPLPEYHDMMCENRRKSAQEAPAEGGDAAAQKRRNIQDFNEIVAALDARPVLKQAVESQGLSTREYTQFEMTSAMTLLPLAMSMAFGGKAQCDAKDPDKTDLANCRFLLKHMDAFKVGPPGQSDEECPGMTADAGGGGAAAGAGSAAKGEDCSAGPIPDQPPTLTIGGKSWVLSNGALGQSGGGDYNDVSYDGAQLSLDDGKPDHGVNANLVGGVPPGQSPEGKIFRAQHPGPAIDPHQPFASSWEVNVADQQYSWVFSDDYSMRIEIGQHSGEGDNATVPVGVLLCVPKQHGVDTPVRLAGRFKAALR
ncbi:MAG: hypothetical protein P4L83_24955 [Nevskia sp.]|nr:hypothetical protein [Nevskia sp.]